MDVVVDDTFHPFPVEVLPVPIRSFVAKGAQAIGCGPSYIALPILSALAGRSATRGEFSSSRAGRTGDRLDRDRRRERRSENARLQACDAAPARPTGQDAKGARRGAGGV